jgi:hypothetical protein
MSDQDKMGAELQRLRDNGLILPKHPQRAIEAYGDTINTNYQINKTAERDLRGLEVRIGRPITQANYDTPEVQRIMGENKALSNAMASKRGGGFNRQASSFQARRSAIHDKNYPSLAGKYGSIGAGGGGAMGGDVYNAIPRFYDPLEYWDLSGLPWNIADEGHRHKLHKWLRLYYATHYLVPSLIDIFTRFPLIGMELEHKDPALKAIYEDIFLGNLEYDDFFVSMGREVWTVGEAFPLGQFDEDLGVWTHEELINPEDIVIDNFPLLDTQQLKIVPPDYLRRIVQTKSPAREWYMLNENYSELIPYLQKGEHIPISPVMLRQVANKLNDWDDHGTPILLRGLRTLLHEEKLLASQDAIAERLYSPFILAKLGIMDMGDGLPPWVPGPEQLESVRDDIDIAMASDFRVMVHHFGLEMSSVFGREQMPRLGDDFDRIERRLFQVFGINPSLLSGGSNSQPYASSALQAEFMNQVLRTFQKQLKKHYMERALVVAEAQGHQDFERKGQTRIPLYETIVTYDDEGNKTLKEVPKYTCPQLNFSTFDLRDEATERQFLMELRQIGVPIPDSKLMVGIEWDITDVTDDYNRELEKKTISQQRAKMDTYIALTVQGLPVPADLKAEVESVLIQGAGAAAPPGGAGAGDPGPGGPPGSPIVMPDPPPDLGSGPGTAPPGGGAPPTSPIEGGPAGNVPEVSNERRPGLDYGSSVTSSAPTLETIIAVYKERARLAKLMLADEEAEVDTNDESAIVDEELELKDNQELREGSNKWKFHGRTVTAEQSILEVPKKRKVSFETEKKYSIVDPLAEIIDEELEDTDESKEEQAE